MKVNGRVFLKKTILVVTKSIRVYKDYEVRTLEVKHLRVGGAVGGAVGGVEDSPTKSAQ